MARRVQRLPLSKWTERAVVAFITLMFGAAAQGLLAWREISILTTGVEKDAQANEDVHKGMLKVIDDISLRQREVVMIQTKLAERLDATKEELKEHKALKGHAQ